MEWLKGLFSSEADASRVHPVGIAVMATALLLCAFAGNLARRFFPEREEWARGIIKITALIICAGGALLAILG